MILSCITNQTPHYILTPISLFESSTFFSSVTLPQTYCTRSGQPVHIIAVCGNDKQFRLYIVNVCDRKCLQPSSLNLFTETQDSSSPSPRLPPSAGFSPPIAIICKLTVFTINNFTHCFQANVLISF